MNIVDCSKTAMDGESNSCDQYVHVLLVWKVTRRPCMYMSKSEVRRGRGILFVAMGLIDHKYMLPQGKISVLNAIDVP